jgi:multidrug efflux pump subunit AcrB
MNPIAFALRRPWTVLVLVAATALGGLLAATRMRIDIFPNLNLPVIYVCQPYGGMDPAQMEGLLTNYYEYHFLYINNIHHVESRNVQGMALMRLVFHPGTDMAQAMAETMAYVTRSRAFMPPGTVSPFVTRFDAGSVPVGFLVLSSASRSIGEIQDQALFKVRPMFAALPGVSAPPPFGGSQRTVVIRLDPERLKSYRMAPDEVLKALASGNVISPSGTVRIDDLMPIVPVNALVKEAKELESIPIRPGSHPTVYLRDVATVRDSSDIAVGYALVDGRRAVYILVTKRADASTLDVVNNVKRALPDMRAVLPDDISVRFEFDQSPTVVRAISSLAVEAALGAGLIGLMVLLFLRDWRSVLIVVLNIPFALCGALVGLWLTGQSLNLMTLGGLALAVGILVDESTVEIENIHVQLARTRSVALAVRRGNLETALPRLLAMLCILAVFLPSFFMTGSARALFVPLSLAVAFAMISSYLLSSTFVPVLSAWLLRGHEDEVAASGGRWRGRFETFGRRLVSIRWAVVASYAAAVAAILLLITPNLRRELFPRVDAGRFQVRLKAPAGTRVEVTEALVKDVLRSIDDEAGGGGGGGDAVAISVSYVGLIPSSYPINAIHQWTGGPEEAILRLALRGDAARDVEGLKRRLRTRLATEHPTARFSFEPADIVNDVMSFGSSAPVEVALTGPSFPDTRAYADKVRAELARVPDLKDLRHVQTLDYPTLSVTIDRERAGLSGLDVEQVARSLVTATSSSRFLLPNYWPDPKSGIGYQVQVEVPYQAVTSAESIAQLPVDRGEGQPGSVLLRDVASVKPGTMPGEFDRWNMKRTLTLAANLDVVDLARAERSIDAALKRAGDPPKGLVVEVRGQIAPMRELMNGLAFGLVGALVAVLLMLTASFQSPGLALVSLAAAPAAVAGSTLMLAATGTSLNMQSYMGTIMAVGVAVANAILLVSFAERARRDGLAAPDAAARAASERLRPILMTATAMIAGMLPLALGLGEGGAQSSPLGRAVIGGLAAATLTTLFVLPGVFAMIRGRATRASSSLDPFDPASPRYIGHAIEQEPAS